MEYKWCNCRGDVGKHVEQRVLDSNPVLEAFGKLFDVLLSFHAN